MKLPNARESLFSLKSYAASMLALYLAYSIGLPRPFWAMITGYVVAQPWSGAVRSKALYRLLGSFVGSAVTVYLVPRLSNSPVLLTGAMVLWVGVCLYFSVLDRTPRSYLFMLAGYTAALIGFPSVANPSTVFDTAVARVEEIGLGIICATLVHSLVLPQGLGPALMLRIDAALRDARRWMHDILSGQHAELRDKERRTLANDITQLRILSTHVPFDASNFRWMAGTIRLMQDEIAALTPAVSAVEDRLRVLQAGGQALPADISAVLQDIAVWLNAETPPPQPETALNLQAVIARLTPELSSQSGWRDALLASLLQHLRDLVRTYADCLALRRDIDTGLSGKPPRTSRSASTPSAVLHRDHGLALLSAFSAGVAIAACAAFWIGTAWSSGATATMMAAIFSCLFASQDDPVPGIMLFLTYTIYSIPLSALYLLGILPAIHSFEMLALAIFPAAFILGIFLARPATVLSGLALILGFLGTLALHDTNTADLVSFIEGQIAQIFGVGMAAVIAAIFRTVSADWSARRIQAANWNDLAALAGLSNTRHVPSRHAYTLRMLDRVGLLQSRLANAKQPMDVTATDALKDLRVGRDIAEIQRARGRLPMAAAAIQPVLSGLEKFFSTRALPHGGKKTPEFMAQVDHALASVMASLGPKVARQHAAVALVGIRCAFYPEAADYHSPASLDTSSSL
ncbi:MAG: FUSC family protein [Rugosibacter sp.]